MTLLLLVLLSAPPDTTRRCEAAFTALVEATGMRARVLDEMSKKDPDAETALRKKFVDACKPLPEADIQCPVAKKGEDLKSCAAAMGALQKALTLYIEEKDPGAFERFQRKSMQIEAKSTLKQLERAMLTKREDTGAAFRVIPAPPTPAQDCCKTPDKVCTNDPKLFAAPGWQAIDFEMFSGKIRYHYEITAPAKDGSFVVRASGDPQCNGKQDVWEMKGKLVNGELTFGEIENIAQK